MFENTRVLFQEVAKFLKRSKKIELNLNIEFGRVVSHLEPAHPLYKEGFSVFEIFPKKFFFHQCSLSFTGRT